MAWTTIQSSPEDIDEEIASFASGVTSIDAFSVTSQSRNYVVAVIQYTA
jgi:hypothetical protein